MKPAGVACFCLLILALPLCTAATALAARPLTVEDLWQVKRVGSPALSPDGKWVASEITSFSMDDNDSSSALWLLSTDGKTQKQLTTHKGKNSSPLWSPDGSQLAFLRKVGDEPQVHLISPTGGEARALTSMPMAPSGLKWSKDGKTLYCIAWTWPDTPDDDSHRKKQKSLKENKVKAYVIDDALYRYWDHWLADGKRPIIFAIDLASGKHKNLLSGTGMSLHLFDPTASDYDVSPTGSELCFVAETTKEIGTDFNTDIYALSLGSDRKLRSLTADNPANDSQPSYSPDGKKVAFIRQTTKYFYADRMRIMLHDLATQKNSEVSTKLDRSCSNLTWTPDSQTLYFLAEDAGYQRVGQVSAQADSTHRWLTEKASDRAYALSKDGKTLVVHRSTFELPATLLAGDGQGKELKSIESFNAALLKEWELGKHEEVTFKGADDRHVQMWVVYPPGFDAKKKWPLLQVVHGGPHNGITSDFHYRWNLHLFAAKGYVVSCINFHGSSGFGQQFTDSITADLGTKPMLDIMKGTDYMEALPYIDKTRTTTAGASYGGYMMAWLNGHTDRFKAMVCHAGVYNWHSMLASDVVRSRERPLGALPWGDLTKIDKQSAQRFAANFKTPTLVMHGEKDYRVPITQGFEYYNTLRLKGVPTRLVYFPDENHWILSPQNSRLWHNEFFAWLDKYVGHGPSK